jgi:hypothetical protein
MERYPDFEELIRALDSLINAQVVRQRAMRPYDEEDDFASSLAFSKLPSLD